LWETKLIFPVDDANSIACNHFKVSARNGEGAREGHARASPAQAKARAAAVDRANWRSELFIASERGRIPSVESGIEAIVSVAFSRGHPAVYFRSLPALVEELLTARSHMNRIRNFHESRLHTRCAEELVGQQRRSAEAELVRSETATAPEATILNPQDLSRAQETRMSKSTPDRSPQHLQSSLHFCLYLRNCSKQPHTLCDPLLALSCKVDFSYDLRSRNPLGACRN
jgi:hypothetical protein